MQGKEEVDYVMMAFVCHELRNISTKNWDEPLWAVNRSFFYTIVTIFQLLLNLLPLKDFHKNILLSYLHYYFLRAFFIFDTISPKSSLKNITAPPITTITAIKKTIIALQNHI